MRRTQGTEASTEKASRELQADPGIEADLQLAPTELGKQLQLSLQAQRRAFAVLTRLATIVESSDDAIISRTLSNVITSWNHGAARMYGYKADEIIGKPFALLVPPERRRELNIIRFRIEKGLVNKHYETVRVTKSGRRIQVSQSNFPIRDDRRRIIGIATIARDITSQKKAEIACRESESRLHHLFHHAPVGIILTDVQGRIIKINQPGLAMLGSRRDNCLAGRIQDFFAEPSDWASIIELLRHNQRAEQYRSHMRKRNGTTFPVRIDAKSAKHQAGSQIYWFIRDLSQQVKLEAEVLAIGDRERRKIGSDLHDEICQELTGIEYLCQALKHECKSSALPATVLESIEEIASLVRKTTGKTRELAHGLSPTSAEPDGLVRALQQFTSLILKRYRIKCHLRCPTPILMPDQSTADHLFRIATESVQNAIRHGHATRIDIALMKNKHHLVLRIKDNGVGMDNAQSDEEGMGLQIMKYRASLVGGIWRIKSQRATGTTVSCTIKLGQKGK